MNKIDKNFNDKINLILEEKLKENFLKLVIITIDTDLEDYQIIN